jgi:DNA invertase Pin-like site-specific DNA recombinase
MTTVAEEERRAISERTKAAEEERRAISERTKAALAAAKVRGI